MKKPAKLKFRRTWTIHPRARVKPSGKIYRRGKGKTELYKSLKNLKVEEEGANA